MEADDLEEWAAMDPVDRLALTWVAPMDALRAVQEGRREGGHPERVERAGRNQPSYETRSSGFGGGCALMSMPWTTLSCA